ncbi:MAG: CDP-alcohol phosphatidyltransferase family protein [Clostridiales bacterium]|nr:CDP-alcohol phosphatidyltransferase family protein [Clostridiales bacterium]
MNVPNTLSLIRIAIISPYLYFYLFYPVYGESIALIIFIISGLTDLLDGYIARKYNQITKMGTVLDPLADKLMLVSVLTGFVMNNKINLWLLTLIICKELLIVLGSFILYNEKDEVIPANILGKITTVLFYIASTAIIIDLSLGYSLMIAFFILNIFSLFFYFYKFITLKRTV